MRHLILSSLLMVSAGSPALASSSAWFEADGARLRIVTSGAPEADGTLKGALEVDLDQGWKTYWRDPGGSGVPPSIDISRSTNVATLDMAYPAPMRFDDESGPWVGYRKSVAFPVTFRLAEPGQPATIAADVFIGICETICIPVQASFDLDPASDPDNPEDAAVISDALAALPGAGQPGFGVRQVPGFGDEVVVEAQFPGNPDAVDFFLAGGDGYTLGTPRKETKDGKVTFIVPVLDRPRDKPQGEGLPYTLVTQAGAVGGLIPFP